MRAEKCNILGTIYPIQKVLLSSKTQFISTLEERDAVLKEEVPEVNGQYVTWILFKPLGWHQFFSPNHKQSKHHKNTELLAGQRKHVYFQETFTKFYIHLCHIHPEAHHEKGIKHKRNFSLTQTRGNPIPIWRFVKQSKPPEGVESYSPRGKTVATVLTQSQHFYISESLCHSAE